MWNTPNPERKSNGYLLMSGPRVPVHVGYPSENPPPSSTNDHVGVLVWKTLFFFVNQYLVPGIVLKRFAQRMVPSATLAHKEEWNGADGPNN